MRATEILLLHHSMHDYCRCIYIFHPALTRDLEA